MFRQSLKSVSKLAANASQQTCTRCNRPAGFERTLATISQPSKRFLSHTSNQQNNERIGNTYTLNDYNGASGLSKPKRKSKTQSHKPPKRRLEAASQPLRNVTSSTRGPVLQCIAHTTAAKYDLVSLGVTLRQLGVRWDEVPEGDRERAFVIGPWKGRGGAERLIRGKDIRRVVNSTGTAYENVVEEDDEGSDWNESSFGYGDRGEIWVFNNGSFVTWGLTEEEGRAFLREVIRRRGSSVEIERLAVGEYEVEEMDFVVDPDA